MKREILFRAKHVHADKKMNILTGDGSMGFYVMKTI